MELSEIKVIPESNYWVNYRFSSIDNFIKDTISHIGLELDPDFQRGHVWDVEQQTAYMESIIREIVQDSDIVIRFNARDYMAIMESTDTDLPKTMQCIDGLQRLTAIRKYMKGELKPFGKTFEEIESSPLAIARKRNICVKVYNIKYRKELLKFYYDLNFGGTPHTESEKERILGMIQNG